MKADTSQAEKLFASHIGIPANNRIIFSAPFGVGKTHFLQRYFDKRSDSCNVIQLSPVNYSVSANDDIFELIKVDIIRQLFYSGTLTSELRENMSHVKTASFFAAGQSAHFFTFLFDSFGKIGSIPGSTLVEPLKELYAKYETFRKQVSDDLRTTAQHLEDHLNTYLDRKGNFFEYDFISRSINEKLDEIAVGGKKNVLIIDDFDRVDPEHIFRILNVLSAHNDHWGTPNKFRFDHIVLVCDIDNIRNIFEHKYGTGVDFEGYIDKFFSTDIFHFTPRMIQEFFIENLCGNSEEEYQKEFYSFIIPLLIDRGSLTIRKFIKSEFIFELSEFVIYTHRSFDEGPDMMLSRDGSFIDAKELQLNSKEIDILRFFKFMSIVYGDFREFVSRLHRIKRVTKPLIVKDNAPLLCYIAKQYHLLNSERDDLFVTKHRPSGGTFITGLSGPYVTMDRLGFKIDLAWDRNNRYTAAYPYFYQSRARITDYDGNQETKQVKTTSVIEVLIQLAEKARDRNLLEPIGIVSGFSSPPDNNGSATIYRGR